MTETPKPKTPVEGLLTHERDTESSIGDLNIDTHDPDDLNQTSETDDDTIGVGPERGDRSVEDLSLVREGTKGEEDLGFTR